MPTVERKEFMDETLFKWRWIACSPIFRRIWTKISILTHGNQDRVCWTKKQRAKTLANFQLTNLVLGNIYKLLVIASSSLIYKNHTSITIKSTASPWRLPVEEGHEPN